VLEWCWNGDRKNGVRRVPVLRDVLVGSTAPEAEVLLAEGQLPFRDLSAAPPALHQLSAGLEALVQRDLHGTVAQQGGDHCSVCVCVCVCLCVCVFVCLFYVWVYVCMCVIVYMYVRVYVCA
jgi:hypothetical protein